jgi:plasmid segregation protein ParM
MEVFLMSEYILSVDAGKDTTKCLGRNAEGKKEDIKKVSFPTKMYDMADGSIDVEGNSFKLEIEGRTLVIGEQGLDDSSKFETSKTSELHKYAIYTAIAQYLEPGTTENKIYMVLSCPLSVVKIDAAKEKYKQMIKGNGPISIKVNDKSFEFEVMDITIKAEDSGITYVYPEMFKDKEIAIIGFGGLNMGFSLYKNGVCNPRDRFLEEHGVVALTEIVSSDLTALREGNLVNYDMAAKALEDGYLLKAGKIDTESIEVIRKSKEKFLDKAMTLIKSHGYKIENMDTCAFVGGTTNKLADTIRIRSAHYYVDNNPQWVSVEGNYKVAFAKYGKKS